MPDLCHNNTGTGKLQFAYPSTQQQLLVWRTRPRSVMLVMKLGDELLPQLLEVIDFLGRVQGLRVVVEPHVYHEYLHGHTTLQNVHTYTPEEQTRLSEFVDFVVCLGGDGVILHTCYLFRSSIPPIISFNLGSMGFLTHHVFEDHVQDLTAVLFGAQQLDSCTLSVDMDSEDEEGGNSLGVMVTLRMRLRCEIWRSGVASGPVETYEVLNEMVIDRGSNSYLTNVEVYEKGRFITRVQADGILIATPTGSTAYSVSAGGSMVHPNVSAILLTPVCPHSLSFRPIILPDYAELEFRLPLDARASAWVCFDGRSRQEIHRGDTVRVRMSENPVPTINKSDLTSDWFDALERCFKWSDRSQQKALKQVPSPAPPAPSTLPQPQPAVSTSAPQLLPSLPQLQPPFTQLQPLPSQRQPALIQVPPSLSQPSQQAHRPKKQSFPELQPYTELQPYIDNSSHSEQQQPTPGPVNTIITDAAALYHASLPPSTPAPAPSEHPNGSGSSSEESSNTDTRSPPPSSSASSPSLSSSHGSHPSSTQPHPASQGNGSSSATGATASHPSTPTPAPPATQQLPAMSSSQHPTSQVRSAATDPAMPATSGSSMGGLTTTEGEVAPAVEVTVAVAGRIHV
ncbi:MAG: hypothetical protein WDW36_006164 [Sanguina aurantia]